MNAAERLGSLLTGRIGKAAEARWLSIGVIAGLVPLTVTLDEGTVPVASFVGDYTGSVGDRVVVGVLRGSPSVSYIVFGRVAVAPVPVVFTATDTPMTIPDASGSGYGAVSSDIVVSDIPGNAPTDLLVTVNVNHFNPSQVRIWLSPPGAPPFDPLNPAPPLDAAFVLFDGTGSIDSPYTIDASSWIADGTWTLWLADVVETTGENAPPDGTLISWSLSFPPL